MKEITRITTVQITSIDVAEDVSNIEESKERTRKGAADAIKTFLPVDDVVVLNVQDFIRDIAEEEGAVDGKVENAE